MEPEPEEPTIDMFDKFCAYCETIESVVDICSWVLPELLASGKTSVSNHIST